MQTRALPRFIKMQTNLVCQSCRQGLSAVDKCCLSWTWRCCTCEWVCTNAHLTAQTARDGTGRHRTAWGSTQIGYKARTVRTLRKTREKRRDVCSLEVRCVMRCRRWVDTFQVPLCWRMPPRRGRGFATNLVVRDLVLKPAESDQI